jgi:hypothetical protein
MSLVMLQLTGWLPLASSPFEIYKVNSRGILEFSLSKKGVGPIGLRDAAASLRGLLTIVQR